MKIEPIRIILVDDHQLARESWRMLLDFDSRFVVVAECDHGDDAIQKAKELVPLERVNQNTFTFFLLVTTLVQLVKIFKNGFL